MFNEPKVSLYKARLYLTSNCSIFTADANTDTFIDIQNGQQFQYSCESNMKVKYYIHCLMYTFVCSPLKIKVVSF